MSCFCVFWYVVDVSGCFYVQWIENVVCGIFDYQCLIYCYFEGDICVFVFLWQIIVIEVCIGLLVGCGVGVQLMQVVWYWVVLCGFFILWVVIQMGNIVVFKCYIFSGVNVESIVYWLYR